MKEQEIYNHQLAIRYFEGRITPSEEEILFRFVNDAPSNERMFRQWEEEWMLSYKLIAYYPHPKSCIYKLNSRMETVATPDAGASIAE